MIKYLDGVLETVEYKDMEGVRLYINNSTLDYPLHWHTAIEIIMPCENQYSVTVNGKKTVLEEGDICIIPPGVLFSSAMVYSIMLRFFAGVGSYFVEKKIFQDSEDKETEANMNGYIEKILGICTYLKEHCTEEVDMEQVAQMAGFSYYHFSRLFKQMMNISCYHYLIQRRLEYAETLLMEPSVSITEVAMRSGFNSIATFNRVFKKEKGCTPSAFRQLNVSFWES